MSPGKYFSGFLKSIKNDPDFDSSRNFGWGLLFLFVSVGLLVAVYLKTSMYWTLALYGTKATGVVVRVEDFSKRSQPGRNTRSTYILQLPKRQTRTLNLSFPLNKYNVGDRVEVIHLSENEEAVLAGPDNTFLAILDRQTGIGTFCFLSVMWLLMSTFAFLYLRIPAKEAYRSMMGLLRK